MFIRLLGQTPSPCYHHDSVMAVCSCRVLKERFAKTRSLHPSDAVQGFGCPQQVFCNAKEADVYASALLALYPDFLTNVEIEAKVIATLQKAESYIVHLKEQYRQHLLETTNSQ